VSVRLTVVGTHHITATAADSGGQTRAASITVTVYAAPPVLTIVAPADGFSTSGAVTFSGTALDFKDGDRANTIRWSSNVAGSLATGATVTAARRAAGRHVITAAVTDGDNATSTKTSTIGVGNAPAAGEQVPVGSAVTFTRSALDEAGDIWDNLAWVSRVAGVIGNRRSFRTSTLSAGPHRIVASVSDSAGAVGSATIAITVSGGGI